MWWSVTLSLLLVLVASLVLYCRRCYRYFEERGVRTRAPLPLIGTHWRSTFFRQPLMEDLRDSYNAFPDEKYVGAFEGLNPVVLIRDPELIKKITVKDFEYFIDHRSTVSGDGDHMLTDSLLFLKGQKWRDMRGTLSPAFTGSKMKMMVPFIEEISKQVVKYLHIGKSSEAKDLYDLFTRYTNDVIASCAFGFKVNSLTNKTNDFYSMGRIITTLKTFKFILVGFAPRLCKLLNITILAPEATGFFRDIVINTMRNREENHETRSDMIQLLMEARSGTLKHTASTKADDGLGSASTEETKNGGDISVKTKWTDDELAAQAFLFFFAGFETAATALTFAAHELALNPDVQARLQAEAASCRAQHPHLTYEALQGLHYMDMVISESLRKWGGAVILDRECQKEYVLEPPHPGGKPLVLKPKDYLYVLVNAIHLDPQYFPEPHKFDPERFSEDRKHDIKPFTYLPFGSGPRNCIGSRFALMELKAILYHLVLDFELVPCEKTCSPISLAIGLKIMAVGGSWIQFKPRRSCEEIIGK